MKKDRYKSGNIVTIQLNSVGIAVCKLFENYHIKVYDHLYREDDIINLSTLKEIPALFYITIHKDVVRDDRFQVIGHEPISEEEIKEIPPRFHQRRDKLEECTLIYYDGNEKKGTPNECIGLERLAVWEEDGIINRLINHYTGKKDLILDHLKVQIS